MKKSGYFLLLVSLMMIFVVPAWASEEEISLSQTLQGYTPPPETVQTLETSGTEEETVEVVEVVPAETLPDGSTSIIVSAVGDITIGGDVRKSGLSIFDKEKEKQGGDLSFVMRNVRDLLSQDHLTIGNFEGTLTSAGIPSNKKGNSFLFSAPPEYVSILNDGSFEAVSFENNHVMDHGEEGFNETTSVLEKAGIVWSAEDHIGVYETNGVSIGMLSYQTFNGRYPDLFTKVPAQVQEAKGLYDIVIVSFHWGDELDYAPNNNQVKLGRLTIDAGADLVVGHHSHRINPIEKYKDRYIAYSVANFSFAGNTKPQDMSTFILQVKFNVKDGETTTAGFRIIPARISSKADFNDFAPTPFTEQSHIDTVIKVLKSNGKSLEYAVENYPTEWE